MSSEEFKPVIIEVTEIGREVIRFALNTPEDFRTWWQQGSHEEYPKFGDEALGSDF